MPISCLEFNGRVVIKLINDPDDKLHLSNVLEKMTKPLVASEVTISKVFPLALEYHNGDKWMELLNRLDMPIWSVIVIALILLGQKLQSEAKLREAAR